MMFGSLEGGEKKTGLKGGDLWKRPERIEIQTRLNQTFTVGSRVLKVRFVTFQENFQHTTNHLLIKEILSY